MATSKKEFFYYYDKFEDGDRCINCDHRIAGPDTALFFNMGARGPFCRPECIAKYFGLKGKMRKAENESNQPEND